MLIKSGSLILLEVVNFKSKLVYDLAQGHINVEPGNFRNHCLVILREELVKNFTA